jgi:hypothetical protein
MAFSKRANAACINFALRHWKGVVLSHQAAHALAAKYNTARLTSSVMVEWKNHLRRHARMKRNAIVIDKYLIMRRCWRTIRTQFHERKRAKVVEYFERKQQQRYLQSEMIRLSSLVLLMIYSPRMDDKGYS